MFKIFCNLPLACPGYLLKNLNYDRKFLEILGEAAIEGTIKGYFEGELSDTVKASGNRAPRKVVVAKKRRKPNPAALRMAAQFGELEKLDAGIDATIVIYERSK